MREDQTSSKKVPLQSGLGGGGGHVCKVGKVHASNCKPGRCIISARPGAVTFCIGGNTTYPNPICALPSFFTCLILLTFT